MSRREEVEASIKWIMSAGLTGGAITPNLRDLTRTLADDVDARDRIITELLAMLKPGEEPNDTQYCFNLYPERDFRAAHKAWEGRNDLYARACKIAGRTE